MLSTKGLKGFRLSRPAGQWNTISCAGLCEGAYIQVSGYCGNSTILVSQQMPIRLRYSQRHICVNLDEDKTTWCGDRRCWTGISRSTRRRHA